MAPYYNKPTQEGLYQHFLEISRASKLPIILYSIPSRCGVEIAVDTVRRLAAATPRVVGIKEAGGNPDRVTQLRAALGKKFAILSGDDSLTLPFMALGAHGVISVASNIIPRQVAQMVRAAAGGDFAAAAAVARTLASALQRPVHRDQSRPRQSRSRHARTNPRRISPAAGAAQPEEPRNPANHPHQRRPAPPMTRIIITGSKGRMGQALLRCAAATPGIVVAGQVDLGQDLRDCIASCDVVVDFTFHESTGPLARICAEHRKPMVIGTTGHNDAEQKELARIAGQIPMVWTANFSTGVNALFWLTRKAAEVLGSDYDVEILEMHHRLKKDAPSGTARALAQVVSAARHSTAGAALRHGREGLVGERPNGEIGIHALRGGDIIGEHTVMFAANGERLELTHQATSRDNFAIGALRAAQWVAGKQPGVYDMQDVMGLR